MTDFSKNGKDILFSRGGKKQSKRKRLKSASHLEKGALFLKQIVGYCRKTLDFFDEI